MICRTHTWMNFCLEMDFDWKRKITVGESPKLDLTTSHGISEKSCTYMIRILNFFLSLQTFSFVTQSHSFGISSLYLPMHWASREWKHSKVENGLIIPHSNSGKMKEASQFEFRIQIPFLLRIPYCVPHKGKPFGLLPCSFVLIPSWLFQGSLLTLWNWYFMDKFYVLQNIAMYAWIGRESTEQSRRGNEYLEIGRTEAII
jgi:hypothetical protein